METIRNMVLSGEMQFYVSATTLIAMIVITFKVTSYINALKTKIDSNEKRVGKVEDKTDSITSEHNMQKLNIVVLETKLDSIELGIVDIKSMLLKHIEKQ